MIFDYFSFLSTQQSYWQRMNLSETEGEFSNAYAYPRAYNLQLFIYPKENQELMTKMAKSIK